MTREEKFELALRSIACIGGNLPDDRLTTRTGPNDAVHRELLYVHARRLAREALDTPAPIPDAHAAGRAEYFRVTGQQDPEGAA